MTLMRKVPVEFDITDLALSGFGTPIDGKRSFAMTKVNRLSCRDAARPIDGDAIGAATSGQEPATKLFKRPSYSESTSIPVSPFAFDMLARASSVNDGNGHFDAYEQGRKQPGDSSIQYYPEANQTMQTLEGLNIVEEDLVQASLLSLTTRQMLKPGDIVTEEGFEDDAIAALIRVVMRIAMDAPDRNAAAHNITRIQDGLAAAAQATLFPGAKARAGK